ncbi:MAG: hypothetical protein KBT76_13190 [Sulfitobacter litoralis]|nr:hypothetical protein [Sulfitobacter litoralis]
MTAARRSIAELGGPYKFGSADTYGRTSIGRRVRAMLKTFTIKAKGRSVFRHVGTFQQSLDDGILAMERHLQSGKVA